jgi:hypothetical protein
MPLLHKRVDASSDESRRGLSFKPYIENVFNWVKLRVA